MNLNLKKKIDKQLKSRQFTYLEDPGHGYLIVTLEELEFFGLEEEISPFSFMSSSFIYLEEDLDAVLFVNKFKNRYGYFEYDTKHENSAHCRAMESYKYPIAKSFNTLISHG